MPGLSPVDWIAFVSFFVFSLLLPISFSSISRSGARSSWYCYLSSKIRASPPGWVFSLVWILLYVLIWIAIFLWWRNEQGDFRFDTILILFIINMFLNALWAPTFFFSFMGDDLTTKSKDLQVRKRLWNVRINYIILGLFLTIATWGTALATLILFGLARAWISFGLYLPYVLWTVFSIVLNAWYLSVALEIRQDPPIITDC